MHLLSWIRYNHYQSDLPLALHQHTFHHTVFYCLNKAWNIELHKYLAPSTCVLPIIKLCLEKELIAQKDMQFPMWGIPRPTSQWQLCVQVMMPDHHLLIIENGVIWLLVSFQCHQRHLCSCIFIKVTLCNMHHWSHLFTKVCLDDPKEDTGEFKARPNMINLNAELFPEIMSSQIETVVMFLLW